jgi:hypothetical protein
LLISVLPKYGGAVDRDRTDVPGADILSEPVCADDIDRGEDVLVLDYALGHGKSLFDVSSCRNSASFALAFGLARVALSLRCRYAVDISMIRACRGSARMCAST